MADNGHFRRQRTANILKPLGVPMNSGLPTISDDDLPGIREPEEVVPRAICLLIVAAKGSGVDPAIIPELIQEYGVEEDFTPLERAFLEARRPTKTSNIQFSWCAEAAFPLFWALGFFDELGIPQDHEPMTDASIEIIDRLGLQRTIEDAKMRTTGEILNQLDVVFCCHWACRDAELKGKHPPKAISGDVLMEWHRALNWLTYFGDDDWDDVGTDT